ncbi:MAG: hypothetical protein KJN90_06495 [Gammaproteobacteria bacterium]|nr:hypothetical protein [Gammaproteobacteria bacterium]
MKRYDLFTSPNAIGPSSHIVDPAGQWVRYDDAQAEIKRLSFQLHVCNEGGNQERQKLEQEIERLREQVADLQDQLDAMLYRQSSLARQKLEDGKAK